jgi:hypothetical protein
MKHIMQPAAALRFDQDDAGTTLVDIRLLDLQRTSIGRIRADAAVEIEVGEIIFVIQGIVVSRDRQGRIHVDLPTFQRDGRPIPTFVLPDELIDPVGRLVFAAYREMVAPV